ncbi:dihydrolipoamide acetyltransferase family protein [Sphingosinicella humi]|uniref:Dihydrolipoamide acetyltransferase component of pyruvate dehydrogenase complex n=1 Tax=Allosphingosinicella humi TaxID=2068657 RepID=A0A2U2IZV4_9SPHN|nr:dihydrolipoamide acetyltransferase family protein [Sphingosinicella humi]PWG01615.1 branched-chain alpha-keto acid dehydrogenase subunit E2 [Sphingosinicella humi]
MARYEFKLPDIGEGIAEAEVVAWHVKVGDAVEEDQPLADMMTDKATVEMESPVAGKVIEVAGEVGDQIAIGSVLVVFETSAEAAEAAAEAEETGEEAALADGLVEVTAGIEEAVPSADVEEPRQAQKPFVPSVVEGRSSDSVQRASTTLGTNEVGGNKKHVLASPAVRQRARDLGIDLAQVQATSDRIRHTDLDAYLLYNGGAVARPGAATRRQDEQVKVVGLRRKIAENMQAAKRHIPHFTYVDEVDVTALEQTRAMMNADRGGSPKLTLLPLLITGMCRVLADYPQINARYDDEANIITRSGAVHMGMATQTDNGLAVPVIRDAQDKSVWQLAAEILRLADATRAGKATREELSGSTITISSLGPMGGIVSTPVINRPEVAIIAVNKVKEMPVVVDGDLEIRKMMNLSLSCDHRVVDGWDAASFIQDLKKLLENPLRLLSL